MNTEKLLRLIRIYGEYCRLNETALIGISEGWPVKDAYDKEVKASFQDIVTMLKELTDE